MQRHRGHVAPMAMAMADALASGAVLVAGRKAGDRPSDRRHPELVMQRAMFELTVAAFAVPQQSRHDLDVEHDARMTDSEFIEAAHTAPRTIVDVDVDADRDSEISGRPKFQLHSDGVAWPRSAG